MRAPLPPLPLLEAAARGLYRLPLAGAAPALALLGALVPAVAWGDPYLSPAYWRPTPHPSPFEGPPLPALAGAMLLNNVLVGVAVPWLLGRLAPFAPRLFVLLWALRVGLLASPAGLPQGGWYLLWSAPVLVGEFAVYGQAAELASRGAPRGRLARRLGAALAPLALLALLALYEAYVIARVL